MIRLTLLWMFITFLGIYAWKDWYKALCGLVLLMAVIQHPDMPKSIAGIQGLNPWNILFFIILSAWALTSRGEELSWDMPPIIHRLLIVYCVIIFIAFFRLLSDPHELVAWEIAAGHGAPSVLGLWSEHIINSIKWVVPGMLLFYGCRDQNRLYWAMAAILGLYILIGIQVIKWMPLENLTSGDDLEARSTKILLREVGYHRVNLSMMLAGASWAIFSVHALVNHNRRWVIAILGLSFIVFFAQALTGGRTGYGTWAVVGFALVWLRWRKYLLVLPVIAFLILLFVPAAVDRMTQGFTAESRDTNVRIHGRSALATADGPDAYTITAGRNVAWPMVIERIKESPWTGYGLEGMKTTRIAATLYREYGEVFPHPHNAYLQAILDNGILGALPILIFYYVIVRYSMSLFRDSSNPVFIAVGGMSLSLVMALLVASMGSQTFYPREGAIGMWCAIGIMLRVYVERARLAATAPDSDEPVETTVKQLWQRSPA